MARHGLSLIDVENSFGTEEQCVAYLQAARWPEGVRCLKCGSDKVSKFATNETTREITDDHGNVVAERKVPSRILFQCNAELESKDGKTVRCRHQFSVTAGTLFDKSHLPLTTWFKAIAILINAKKSVSARQMERDLGVNYRTAWFLNHRIRKAMWTGTGFFGGVVELDATHVGGKYDPRRKRERYEKQPVMGVVQRSTADRPSQVQAFVVAKENAAVVDAALAALVEPGTQLYTDEHAAYRHLGKTWKHAIVIHSKDEYVRDGVVHTNTVENFWSLFKRQIVGQHHWVSVKHLQRYLDECQYKFNNRESKNLFAMVVLNLVIGSALRYAILTAPVLPSPSEPLASE